MNRRDFLMAGAAGLAMSAVGGYVAGAQDRKPLRVGLIGTGWYGKSDLLRLIQVVPVEVVSLCDVDWAVRELEWALDRDARTVVMRPAAPTTALFFRIPFQPRRARLHYASVEKIFKRYAQRARVPIPAGIAFHHLRHTAGQQMANVGLGIEEAQRLLGHESPVTTQVYYEVTDARLRRAAQRLQYGGPPAVVPAQRRAATRAALSRRPE